MLRWLVLWVLFGLLAGAVFLAGSSYQIGKLVLGSDTIGVNLSIRVDFSEGDRFGFRSDSGLTACTVTPRNGIVRSYQVYDLKQVRGAGKPVADRAWFTGPAEINCARPAEMFRPSSYRQDEAVRYALIGSLSASGLCLIVGIAQLYRRNRWGLLTSEPNTSRAPE